MSDINKLLEEKSLCSPQDSDKKMLWLITSQLSFWRHMCHSEAKLINSICDETWKFTACINNTPTYRFNMNYRVSQFENLICFITKWHNECIQVCSFKPVIAEIFKCHFVCEGQPLLLLFAVQFLDNKKNLWSSETETN